MPGNILAPAAILVLWSLIMLLWMAISRFSAAAKANIDPKSFPPGGRGQDLQGVLPDKVMWKSHNYTHLMEQPTIYYAAVLILASTGAHTPLLVSLAWAYTLLRIIHSIWQATINTVIPVRFGLFILSTACLLVLAVYAVIATI